MTRTSTKEIEWLDFKKNHQIYILKILNVWFSELPINIVTNVCNSRIKILFLKNFQSTCDVNCNAKDQTISSIYYQKIKNKYLISSPELFNTTWLENMSVKSFSIIFNSNVIMEIKLRNSLIQVHMP